MKARFTIMAIAVVTICAFKVTCELREVRMKRNLVEIAKETDSIVTIVDGREQRYKLAEKTRIRLVQAVSTAEFIFNERKRVCLGKLSFRDKLDKELLRLTIFDAAVFGYGERQINFKGGVMSLSDFKLTFL